MQIWKNFCPSFPRKIQSPLSQIEPVTNLLFPGSKWESSAGSSCRLQWQSGGCGGWQQPADGGTFAGLGLLTASERVHDGVLDKSAEHEHQAGGHPDVDGFGERAGRHAAQETAALRGDGENGEDAEWRASWSRLQVDPERQPRQQNYEETRQVRRQDVGAQSTLKVEISAQTREVACNRPSIIITITVIIITSIVMQRQLSTVADYAVQLIYIIINAVHTRYARA